MPWASVRSCAAAIRTSSCVNLSNRLRASPISVFPNSFFRYLSDQQLAKPIQKQAYGKLTRSPVLYLLRRSAQNIQDFNHDLDNDIRHCLAWSNLRIGLQTFEKVLDTFKNVDHGLLRRIYILHCLTSFDVKGLRRDVDKIPTWRRTPAPAKITVAGEKTYVVNVNFAVLKRQNLILTRLTPPPMVAENERRTLTVGLSHFVNLSSLFRAWFRSSACPWRTARIEAGESQA